MPGTVLTSLKKLKTKIKEMKAVEAKCGDRNRVVERAEGTEKPGVKGLCIYTFSSASSLKSSSSSWWHHELLALRDELVHVAFSFSEIHVVHALTYVPVKECLPVEYGSEIL